MHLSDPKLLAVWQGMNEGVREGGVKFFKQMHQYGIENVTFDTQNNDDGLVFSRQLAKEAYKEKRVRHATLGMMMAYIGDGLLSVPSIQALVLESDHIVVCFNPAVFNAETNSETQGRPLVCLGGDYHEGLNHVSLSNQDRQTISSLVQLYNDFSKEIMDLERVDPYAGFFDVTFVQGKPKSYLYFLQRKDYLVEQLFPFAERQLYLSNLLDQPSQRLKKM